MLNNLKRVFLFFGGLFLLWLSILFLIETYESYQILQHGKLVQGVITQTQFKCGGDSSNSIGVSYQEVINATIFVGIADCETYQKNDTITVRYLQGYDRLLLPNFSIKVHLWLIVWITFGIFLYAISDNIVLFLKRVFGD